MDFQFYPTPLPLAKLMWAKFTNKNISRVLDPSGGNGDLLKAAPWKQEKYSDYRNYPTCDACEIDVTRHPALKENQINVVGLDFMQFQSCAIYDRIIANPPFRNGDKHVLRMWDLMLDGEIVAIINADTIRNPCTQDRQRLRDILMEHGDCQIFNGAFEIEEAERKTSVDIALIHLTKKADADELVGNLLKDLSEDKTDENDLAGEFANHQQLALPSNTIENTVRVFRAAIQSMRDSVFAEARANYYSTLLGQTMAEIVGEMSKPAPRNSIDYVKTELASRYDKLKDQAWTSILRGSEFKSRLSSKAQKRLETEFDTIKKLEFTYSNVMGFLLGIIESQGQIQIDMMCDVFDHITRYGTDNACYFRGWKSNDKHRTAGRRIKTTRFIIPGFRGSPRNGFDYDCEQTLRDFDKVFALVDAKLPENVTGLVWSTRQHWDLLRQGQRVQTEYFDLRYYAGAGTIHFYPTDRALIDRFNRIVGRHRQWLPPSPEEATKDFWTQYEKAEKFTSEYEKAIKKASFQRSIHDRTPFERLGWVGHRDEQEKAEIQLDQAMKLVQDEKGLKPFDQLEAPKPATQQLLLAA